MDLPRRWKAGITYRREELIQADRDRVQEDRYVVDLEKGLRFFGRTHHLRLRYQDGEELMDKFNKDEQRHSADQYLTLRWKFDDRLKHLFKLEWDISIEGYADVMNRKYAKSRIGAGLSREFDDLKIGVSVLRQLDADSGREKIYWQLGAGYDLKVYKLIKR